MSEVTSWRPEYDAARSAYLFTSESASEGHPDKVADQISDAIVDLFLSKDPSARIACEALTTTQLVVLADEIRCKGIYENGEWAPGVLAEIEQVVRGVVRDIGYEQDGFHWQSLRIENNLHVQSPQIAQGVDASGNKDEGADDQGIMFGFACSETPALMPATLYYSHKILERMSADRHSGAAPFLKPDAKCQVTFKYEYGKPVVATAIVVSTQHAAGYDVGSTMAELRAYVKQVIADTMPAELLSGDTVYHINPTGAFEIGGPDGDAGLTGRRIAVDNYGGAAPHGGGAFSGKDPTRVDRSAAYMARYLAKNIVAAGIATRCTIQLAYAIGVAQPLSLYVDTHGTGRVTDSVIEHVILKLDKLNKLTPRAIRDYLGLNKPIYRKTAVYGHFGRTADGDFFPWERTDLVGLLTTALSSNDSVQLAQIINEAATLSAHVQFEPVVAEAGSFALLRMEELLGRIFQNARIKSELVPIDGFSFLLRVHVTNDSNEVSRILKALLRYHGGEREIIERERLAGDFQQELTRLDKILELLLRFAVSQEGVDGVKQHDEVVEQRLQAATASFHDSFLAAVQSIGNPF